MAPNDVAAWIDHIGEDHRGSAKDVVFECHTSVDRDIILDLDIVSQNDTGSDHDILTEVAALANLCLAHDMTEMPYLRAVTNLTAFVNHGRRICKVIHAGFRCSLQCARFGHRYLGDWGPLF